MEEVPIDEEALIREAHPGLFGRYWGMFAKAQPVSRLKDSSPSISTHPEDWAQIRRRQPTCRVCKEVAVRQLTSPLNTRNAGRHYYICPSCPREDRWVCWEDTKGISASNPPCDCEEPSRLNVIGKRKGPKARRGSWACVTGKCWYYSGIEDGMPGVIYDGSLYP